MIFLLKLLPLNNGQLYEPARQVSEATRGFVYGWGHEGGDESPTWVIHKTGSDFGFKLNITAFGPFINYETGSGLFKCKMSHVQST